MPIVKIERITDKADELIAGSAKLCYSKTNPTNVFKNLNAETVERMTNLLVNAGHGSPFEHASVTFSIQGISRACSHQLVRHRIASYSQQSQRYVDLGRGVFIIPPSIFSNQEALTKYDDVLEKIGNVYQELIDMGIPKEDARYLLPNATTTNLIMTMNFRQLFHFFNLRCCSRAQWEIRNLANDMLDKCKEVYPNIFKNAGAPCISGKCPEGEMSCKKGGNK